MASRNGWLITQPIRRTNERTLDEQTFDIVFVIVLGLVAWHGLTFRTKDGEREWVHLYFGCIALMYGLWVLFSDLLGLF